MLVRGSRDILAADTSVLHCNDTQAAVKTILAWHEVPAFAFQKVLRLSYLADHFGLSNDYARLTCRTEGFAICHSCTRPSCLRRSAQETRWLGFFGAQHLICTIRRQALFLVDGREMRWPSCWNKLLLRKELPLRVLSTSLMPLTAGKWAASGFATVERRRDRTPIGVR